MTWDAKRALELANAFAGNPIAMIEWIQEARIMLHAAVAEVGRLTQSVPIEMSFLKRDLASAVQERDRLAADLAAVREENAMLVGALVALLAEWDVAPWHRSDRGPEAPYCLSVSAWKRLNYVVFSEKLRAAVKEQLDAHVAGREEKK